MNKNLIVSPCISICKSDPVSWYCYGCGRSDSDKVEWNNPDTSNDWKEENLNTIRNRLSGWQQIAFDKSYENKKKFGVTLFKKRLLESKK